MNFKWAWWHFREVSVNFNFSLSEIQSAVWTKSILTLCSNWHVKLTYPFHISSKAGFRLFECLENSARLFTTPFFFKSSHVSFVPSCTDQLEKDWEFHGASPSSHSLSSQRLAVEIGEIGSLGGVTSHPTPERTGSILLLFVSSSSSSLLFVSGFAAAKCPWPTRKSPHLRKPKVMPTRSLSTTWSELAECGSPRCSRWPEPTLARAPPDRTTAASPGELRLKLESDGRVTWQFFSRSKRLACISNDRRDNYRKWAIFRVSTKHSNCAIFVAILVRLWCELEGNFKFLINRFFHCNK